MGKEIKSSRIWEIIHPESDDDQLAFSGGVEVGYNWSNINTLQYMNLRNKDQRVGGVNSGCLTYFRQNKHTLALMVFPFLAFRVEMNSPQEQKFLSN